MRRVCSTAVYAVVAGEVVAVGGVVVGSVVAVSVVAVGDVDDNDTDVCRVSVRSSGTPWLQ